MNNDAGASRRGVKVGAGAGAKAKESFDVFAKETRHHLPMVGPWLTGTAKPFFRLTFSMVRTPGKVLASVLIHRRHSDPTPPAPAPPFFSAGSGWCHAPPLPLRRSKG